jgi:hypothetical protein
MWRGVAALDEVIVHGWNVAVAGGQTFSCEDNLVEAVYGFIEPIVAQDPSGTPGLFVGPPVKVPDDEPCARPAATRPGSPAATRPGSPAARQPGRTGSPALRGKLLFPHSDDCE